ncbi:hypothetical protein MNV49_002974 [Pseudohyphozyma bogoriensis]|nr:hypothetical protein MNV49_002974 [Pseudohyphozyma bogoriensis]
MLILEDFRWFVEPRAGWGGAEAHDFSVWRDQAFESIKVVNMTIGSLVDIGRAPLSEGSLRAITAFITAFPNLTHLVLWDWLSEEAHEGSWASPSLPDFVVQHPLVSSLIQYVQLATNLVSLRFESLHCYRQEADPETLFVRQDILTEVDGEFVL